MNKEKLIPQTLEQYLEVHWEKSLCSSIESANGSVSGGVCIFTALVNKNDIVQIGAIIRGQTLVTAHVISLGR